MRGYSHQYKRMVDAWPDNGTDLRPNLTMVGRYRAIEAVSAAELSGSSKLPCPLKHTES
jgi:hypothetical protein